MPRHDDPAAEALVIVVGRGQRPAFLGREHRADHGAAIDIEVRADCSQSSAARRASIGGHGRASASGSGSAGHAARLPLEQGPLAFEAPAVAGEATVLAHDAVAGNRDRDGVGRAGLAHRDASLGAPIRSAISA